MLVSILLLPLVVCWSGWQPAVAQSADPPPQPVALVYDEMNTVAPCFTGTSWESYTAETSWTLEPGTGWRTVFARTRDALGRTTVVSDNIYLGQSVPLEELGLHLASRNHGQVTLYGLDGGGLPYFQLSENWFTDDTDGTFTLWWGNGLARTYLPLVTRNAGP